MEHKTRHAKEIVQISKEKKGVFIKFSSNTKELKVKYKKQKPSEQVSTENKAKELKEIGKRYGK